MGPHLHRPHSVVDSEHHLHSLTMDYFNPVAFAKHLVLPSAVQISPHICPAHCASGHRDLPRPPYLDETQDHLGKGTWHIWNYVFLCC